MRHTYYDMKGNEHTIEIPDEYIESKRQQAILKASAANLYLLEHGIEYDAAYRPDTDKKENEVSEKRLIMNYIADALGELTMTIGDWEDSPHGIEVGDEGKIRFILNSKTYEMSMVCKRKRKPKAK